MKLTIGVTGHRDLVEHETPGLRNQVRAFFSYLADEFPGLDLQLLSPLAEGSDQLVAEIAVELGIPLVVPLPMSREDYEQDFDTPEGLQNFNKLMEKAEVIRLPLLAEITSTPGGVPGADREMQYMQLGVFISNHCQVLLALWDGKPGTEPGGTADVVNYHLTAVMPGYSISEESPNLLADNENDLTYHIVVSRNRNGGEPADGLKPLDEFWLSAHFERREEQRMPAEFRSMLMSLQGFNADYQKYQEVIQLESQGLLTDAPSIEAPGGAAEVDRLFGLTDWLAVHFQMRFNQGMLVTHALAVVMGLVFLVYTEYGGPRFLLFVFLFLFLFGMVFHFIGSRHQWHRKYLDYRALAEGLRVQLYWNLAGVVDTRSAVFAYDNFLQKQDVDLGWIRHVMRSASLRRDRWREPEPAWVDWVSAQWVGRQQTKTGQLAYYRRKGELKVANYRRTTRLANLSLWVGILIAFALAIATDRLTVNQQHLLLVAMGVLPLMAGVRDTYSHKKAERELIKQYRFMGRVFANARRLLDSTTDLAFKRRVLKAVGSAALEEHAEWILMHRERPLEHSGF